MIHQIVYYDHLVSYLIIRSRQKRGAIKRRWITAQETSRMIKGEIREEKIESRRTRRARLRAKRLLNSNEGFNRDIPDLGIFEPSQESEI